MNNRQKGQTVFIVEGDAEATELVQTYSDLFPGMHLKKENTLIFQTNIYRLHKEIVKEYGPRWMDEEIDIVYLIQKVKGICRNDWIRSSFVRSIYLIFDCDPQDTDFNIKNLQQMQAVFNNETDKGKLYINYPFYESCFEPACNTPGFEKLAIDFECSNTNEWVQQYKARVKKKDNVLRNNVFILKKRITDHVNISDKALNELLEMEKMNDNSLIQAIGSVCLKDGIEPTNELCHYLHAQLFLDPALYTGKTCNSLRRSRFQQAACDHLHKAVLIQNKFENVPMSSQEQLNNLELRKLLESQKGYKEKDKRLYVLNTSLLIPASYNSSWLSPASDKTE